MGKVKKPSNYLKAKKLDKRCRFPYCMETMYPLETHHIIPRSQGGDDELDNLISLCFYHHQMITDNKISDYFILSRLENSPGFRWQKGLEYWAKRKKI